MATNETVREATRGQFRDIAATIIGAIPDDLSFNEAEGITGDKGSFVADIREVFAKRRVQKIATVAQVLAVPADDEWFELEVDDDIDPMEVVRSAGYDPKNWEYLGPKLSGKYKCRAKLVRLGYCHNLTEAREKADKMDYRLLEGQAREPFKKKYSKPDGKSSVIFGGSEWRFPRGDAGATCRYVLMGEWRSSFRWSEDDFGGGWRWAVVSK